MNFENLFEEKETNMFGKDLELMVDGSCDVGLRWKSLLIELQSLRGSDDDDDEMSEELKIFFFTSTLLLSTSSWNLHSSTSTKYYNS